MKKLILLIGFLALISCQAETEETKELSFEACAEINESHLAEVMDATAVLNTWPDATIHIVLSPDFAAIDFGDGINYDESFKEIGQEFTEKTGVSIVYHEEENAPEAYVYYQHAPWNGSAIGTKGGRSYASTNTYTIRENPDTILHFLSHIAGSQTGDIDEVKELY